MVDFVPPAIVLLIQMDTIVAKQKKRGQLEVAAMKHLKVKSKMELVMVLNSIVKVYVAITNSGLLAHIHLDAMIIQACITT